MADTPIELRAARHAALGDPVRLRLVDELATSDRSPVELRRLLGIESNHLAHHLDVLEHVGLIHRARSSGDGRRRYVHLLAHAVPDERRPARSSADRALFVCTRNSARSRLAAAVWQQMTGVPATSAGTEPAGLVHPEAVAAASRAGLPIDLDPPRSLEDVVDRPPVIVTVCDRAHEELAPPMSWLHWSIPDPVPDGSVAAFDATVQELCERVHGLFPDMAGRS